MMTFNIRSIKKNFDNFTKLLSSITVKVHIICLTESWLGTLDNIDDFKLYGYYPPQYQNRIGNMHGGGVVTYMNYNLINLDKHEPTNNYHNILTSCSFKPLITKLTRITDSSKTLIDHIWTNDLRNTSIHNSHILITYITDHLPCLSIVASPDILLKGYRYVTRRQFTEENSKKFIDKITETQHVLSFHVTNTHQLSLKNKNMMTIFSTFPKFIMIVFPYLLKKFMLKLYVNHGLLQQSNL